MIPVLMQAVLILTAAILFYVAFTDLKHYKIRNDVILILAGLFFVYVALSGHWMTMFWNSVFAALLFFLMLYFYSRSLMGGGDLKLLTVAFLWVGPSCVVPFSLLLLLFVGIHVFGAKLKLVDIKQGEGQKKSIAFAPSIAAALIAIFMVGCLNSDPMLHAYHGFEMLGRQLIHYLYYLFPDLPHTG